MRTEKSIQEIARDVRHNLAEKHPACKFSVTVKHYSGGRSMTVALMSAPFPAFAGEQKDQYAQLNQYSFSEPQEEGHKSNGSALTPECWEVMKSATEIARADNWDESDIQTDYFCTNFYLHIHIGKWDRPFICTAALEEVNK